MKGATQCAQRVKQLFRSLRNKLGKVTRPSTSDPISQLILGIFSRDVPESKAREALEQFRAIVVDYNELRVIAPLELAEHLNESLGANAGAPAYPDLRIKCEDLTRALNKIFAAEHTVSLERLSGAPAREVRAYLDSIDGLEPYTRARIRLLGFQQHAIPLDEAMWAYAKKAGIVDAAATLDEAQQFLERQIGADDALEFVALLRKQAWSDTGAAVRKGDVEHIRSVPPDRTSRNMLQLIDFNSPKDADADEEAEPAAAKSRRTNAAGGQAKRQAAAGRRPPAPPGAKAAKPLASGAARGKSPAAKTPSADAPSAKNAAGKSAATPEAKPARTASNTADSPAKSARNAAATPRSKNTRRGSKAKSA
ncbi:MAG: hypothetical protein AB7Q17_05340 [Phycisphaerae bacterium]